MKTAIILSILLAATGSTLAAPAKVAGGSYECWAHSSPRMLLNFSILSANKYKGSDGKTGDYKYDPATGAIAFTSGALNGVMPDGFVSTYHEKNGKPTVSFRKGSNMEASFCEKAK